MPQPIKVKILIDYEISPEGEILRGTVQHKSVRKEGPFIKGSTIMSREYTTKIRELIEITFDLQRMRNESAAKKNALQEEKK